MADSQKTMQQTIAQIYGQTEELCLQMFAESIQKSHETGHDKWGITHIKNDRIRLNVGSIVVCTLQGGGIWFALDKDYNKKYESYLDNAHDSWNWTPIGYKPVPSISGYYKPSLKQSHEETWPRIKEMHFALIDKAADKYKRLRKPCQTTHSTQFLRYLRDRLNRPDVPDPKYLGC